MQTYCYADKSSSSKNEGAPPAQRVGALIAPHTHARLHLSSRVAQRSQDADDRVTTDARLEVLRDLPQAQRWDHTAILMTQLSVGCPAPEHPKPVAQVLCKSAAIPDY